VGGERHWWDDVYGELYLASVEDLLTPTLSAFEAGVVARLLRLRPGDRVLDLGCGHGRHLRALEGRGVRLVGLDRSAAYLRRAAALGLPGGAALVRADVRALPARDGAFSAAFSWYASLFMFDDAANRAALAGLARVVRPGGRVLVHHADPVRLAASPRERAARALAGGVRVEEESAFDPQRGVDLCTRRMIRRDGSVLEGTAELRYYSPAEWDALALACGLRLVDITSTAPGAGAPDLVAVLEKPT